MSCAWALCPGCGALLPGGALKGGEETSCALAPHERLPEILVLPRVVNLTVHPKPLGTLVDYRCRFRVGPVTLPFQQASSEVMLKLLTWDHSVKSKDINGKVTPPPAPHHH